MSWSGFKKNVGRATTQVMMKTGHVERTTNREYEVEERRYRTLESASLRLQKEARGYLDSLRAMTASQMRIAETIDAFYGDSGASDGVSRSYKQAVEDLDAETVKALDGPYRCVPPDLRKKYAWDEEKGVEDKEALRQIEWEMNQGGRERLSGIMRVDMESYGELMDYIYRTTVLEPINRFCAYFPDINECIKKRQHKMLDYDAMRSKVKKLTEKPDKDPGKLPRTEKETEMVSLSQFLTSTHPAERSKASSVPPRKSIGSGSGRSARSAATTDPDLAVPSPPKALNGIRERLGMVPVENAAETGAGTAGNEESGERQNSTDRGRQRDRSSRRTSSVWSRCSSLLSPGLAAETKEAISQHRKSPAGFEHLTLESPRESQSLRSLRPPTVDVEPKEKASKSRAKSTRSQASPPSLPELSSLITYPQFAQPVSRKPVPSTRSASIFSGSSGSSPRRHRDSASTRGACPSTRSKGASSSALSFTSPWFAPGELEEIMRPVKQAFIMKQADDLKQAKAAYEQLNDQLTNELPQLIDLRVPYLDPSFEALVKIQLRFCAEAYSRMAQVQQYLDASTRDQYASGDLDARVEDVLGQIRELSIAGTV